MAGRYDVVVVGARCAGSPLAVQLARAGLAVAVVDQARFPSDTLSTHVFEAEGVASLARLGVLEQLLATGAPLFERVDARFDDLRVQAPLPRWPEDRGAGLCVRRTALDAILVETAGAAGADVRTGTRAVGLLERAGRVAGVRVRTGAREEELEAALVVGADGMNSTVARLVGARRYNVVPLERFGYWGYYEGTAMASPATAVIHRWDEEWLLASPADDGLYLVILIPPLDRLHAFRADPEASWKAVVAACEPVAAMVEGARRQRRLRLAVVKDVFFRESAGPGWVLSGDAGHFKDPTPGQGISDALRQADRLAPAIVEGLGGRRPLDQALARWWRWRDRDAAEMHWFAAFLGRAGRFPPVRLEVLRDVLDRPDGIEVMWWILSHRMAPSKVLTPWRLLTATARMLRRPQRARSAIAKESWGVLTEELSNRWRSRRPAFEAAGAPAAPAPTPVAQGRP